MMAAMHSARPRTGEIERMAALRRYEILDTPPDGCFDRITALVADLLEVPIAIVSLVDTDRIWFKSSHGLDAQQVTRELGLCASAILQDDPYVIEDAASDPRSLANPLVAGALGFRFYAGVPLRTHDGYNLGVLTAIDRKPRTLTHRERRILNDLARVVMDEMELRLAARRVHELNLALQTAHEELRTRAARDSLTGVANREAILERLEHTCALALREGRSLAVMVADIDDFKGINDSYGHLVGDQVLREVTDRFQAVARASDAVGRLGGDEFLVLLYPCDAAHAEATADRIRTAVNDITVVAHDGTHETRDERRKVSVSAGICCTSQSTDARHLLQGADDALYRAKRAGRDRTEVTVCDAPSSTPLHEESRRTRGVGGA